MKNHRAAWSLLAVLAFALAVFLADSGVANARPVAEGCKATAVAHQTRQDLDAPPPCTKHACTYGAKGMMACGHVCSEACGAKGMMACGHVCSEACGAKGMMACGHMCSEACGAKGMMACGHMCCEACGAACLAKCKPVHAAVCGPRLRNACRGADYCDCGKVSCRLYGLACGHKRLAWANKRAQTGCRQPCCQRNWNKAQRIKASDCMPGYRKPCCTAPKKIHRSKASKCAPGCSKPCCMPQSKATKRIHVSKCAPGCSKPCCMEPKKIQKKVRMKKSGSCAKSAKERKVMRLDCNVAGGEGEEVLIMKANPERKHVWVEAGGSGGDKDGDRDVRKIRIKTSDDPEVEEIIIDDSGVWYDDDKGIYVLKAGGEEIAWLGVHLQDLTPELREAFDLPAGVKGALIADVDRSGPARKSGVRKGFVVIEFDGTPIHSADDLIKAVRASEPGDQVTVVMNRKGSEITRRVTLGSREAEVKIQRDFDFEMPEIDIKMPEIDELVDIKRVVGRGGFLGVSAETLTEKKRDKLGLPEGLGVEISEVIEGTAADEVGLLEGDIIVKVDDEDIRETEDLTDAISSRDPGDEVTLFLLRDGEKMKLNVELGERELPKSIKWIGPSKVKPEKRLEVRRDALKKKLVMLHERLEKLKQEIQELNEKLEDVEED